MSRDKLLSSLGLCRRAGSLKIGFDQVAEAIRKGNVGLVLLAMDLSDKRRKNICYEAQKCGVPISELPVTMDEIERILSKRVGILAVTDENFAQLMSKHISFE